MKLDAGLSLQQEVGWERSTIRAARLLASCQDSPFLVSCPGVLPERLARWKESFPLVVPSVSASCSLPSLDLQELGLPLTFTRKQELASLPSSLTSTSTLANSLALASALKAAREMGVDRVTCHSLDQLHKIKKFHPDARVLLELALPCQPAGDSLSSLEGCGAAPEQVSCLLAEARRLAIQVTGVKLPLLLSGQEEELPLLREAVLSARHAVELAALQGGALTEVQVGRLCLAGTAPSSTFLRGVAAALAPVAGLALQGDATHWLAAPSLTLAARVIAVRTRKDPALPIQYYINEGVFGAFSSVLGGECVAAPLPLGGGSRRPGLTSGLLGAELVGPSGDELDVVARDVMLPRVQEDDWLLFPCLGCSGGLQGYGDLQLVEGGRGAAVRLHLGVQVVEGVKPVELAWGENTVVRSLSVCLVGQGKEWEEGAVLGELELGKTFIWEDCCHL